VGKQKKIPTPLYHEYINSPAWRKKRIQAHWCLGKICEACGSNKKIHVHHNNYSSLGSEKTFRDFVILCEVCHEAFHKITPSQKLGKKLVGYKKKCSLCMKWTHKLTEYLSCSTYRRTKDQKERKKRTLRVCEICVGSLTGRLLTENKIAAQKEKREAAVKKKEAKRKKRLLHLEAASKKKEAKRKRRLLRLEARKEKAKLLPPKAPKPKKAKKPKRGDTPYNSPEVLVRRKSSRKTT